MSHLASIAEEGAHAAGTGSRGLGLAVSIPLVFLLLLGVLTPRAGAVTLQDLEGLPIRVISFVGLERLDETELKNRMRLRLGDPFRWRDLNTEYQRLWKTDEYLTIDPDVLREGDGIRIVFRVKEKPRIAEVRFVGADQLRPSDLQELMKTRKGGLFNRFDASVDREKLLRHYQEKGFAFVRIDESRSLTDDGTIVTFRIQEGPRLYVRGMSFKGNYAFRDSDLLKQVRTRARSTFFGIPHGGLYDQKVYLEDLQRLREYYRFKGYLDVVVAAEDFGFNPDRDGIYLAIRVDEGPRYTVDRIQFEIDGERVFTEDTLLGEVQLKPGQPYDGTLAEQDRTQILRLYQRRAYIDVRVRQEFIFSDEGALATLIYRIVEGNEVSIAGVVIRGNEETRDKVIRRELTFYPQEKMNFDRFQESLSNLFRLNYFDNNVAIFPDPTSTAPERDAIVKVQEGTTGNILFGFGVTSGLGAIGNVRLVKRNFDVTDLPESFFDLPNAFTGGGQTLVLEAQPGTELSRYTFTFVEPYLFDSNTSLSIRGARNTFSRFEYDEKRTSIRLGLGQRFLEKKLRAEVTYRFEIVDIGDVEPDAPPDAFRVQGETRISALGLQLTYDRRTYRPIIGPVDGWIANGGVEYAGGFLAADVDQIKAFGGFSIHRTLFTDSLERRHILTLRNTIQWADVHHNTDEVPIFERYFLGGARTVRGFRFTGLGPHFFDEPVGGTAAHYGSLEYTFPIAATWLRGITFLDYGNLAVELDDYETDEYRLTLGGGFVLNIPFFGQQLPISLTWGEAILSEDPDRTRLFLFDIGRVGF